MSESNIYNPPPTEDVEEFAAWMSARWARAMSDKRRAPSQAHGNWASLLGHPCMRHQFYVRTGASRDMVSPRTQAIFESGHAIEDDTVNFIRGNMEVDWIMQQAYGEKDELDIRCRIDGGVKRPHVREPVILAEVKRINDNDFAKITDASVKGVHDMLHRCNWWVSKHPYQGAAYLRQFKEHGLIFVLRNPVNWWAKFVPMPREAPITQELIAEVEYRAKTINQAVEDDNILDRMKYNRSVCGMCDFRDTVCMPDRVHAGAEVINSSDVIDMTAEFMALVPKTKRHKDLRDSLGDLLRGTGHREIVIGGKFVAKVGKSTAKRRGAVRITELQGDPLFTEDRQ